MRNCRKCQAVIPRSIVIEGKRRNLSNRKFCFDCSPWGSHNTKPDVDKQSVERSYQKKTKEEKKDFNKQVYDAQKKRRFERKKKFALLLGGCCSVCGYDKCLSSLAFHHRNPQEKEFNLTSRELGMYKEERLLNEANKCDLLCHNCHTELHNPEWEEWK